MTTTTERRRLTTDEVALMRAIVMWRREPIDGTSWPHVSFYERQYHAGMGDHGRSVWFRIPLVDDPADAYGVVDFANARFDPPRSVEVHSLTEAVDVLVAFDFLPARFSSAYRAGWDANADYLHAYILGQGESHRHAFPAVPVSAPLDKAAER